MPTLKKRIEAISYLKDSNQREQEYNSLKKEIKKLKGDKHTKREYLNLLDGYYNKFNP